MPSGPAGRPACRPCGARRFNEYFEPSPAWANCRGSGSHTRKAPSAPTHLYAVCRDLCSRGCSCPSSSPLPLSPPHTSCLAWARVSGYLYFPVYPFPLGHPCINCGPTNSAAVQRTRLALVHCPKGPFSLPTEVWPMPRQSANRDRNSSRISDAGWMHCGNEKRCGSASVLLLYLYHAAVLLYVSPV